MNNFYLAFSVVFPLLCMMLLGYGLRLVKIFDESFLTRLNELCFKVFLPLILFVNIYKSDFGALLQPQLILFAVVCVTAAFVLLMLLVPLFVKRGNDRGVVVQGIFRSNFILFGLPITASLYGSENTGVTAILIAFVVPLFNALSVVALEAFSAKKSGLRSIVKGIVTNPLILAAACAIFVGLTGIRFPALVETTLSDLSKVSTPLALIVLGGSFRFRNLSNSPALLMASVAGKLLVLPALFLPLAIWLGFRGTELAALLAMLASPTAVSSYTMAQAAGANGELAGQTIVVASLASVVTIFAWLTLLMQLEML